MKQLISNRAAELVRPQQVPFIVAVSAFETGGFKSPLLRRNNNLFGMRFPRKRPTTAIGENGNYSKYATFEDSVTDFYLWMDYTDFPRFTPTVKKFVKEMHDRNYFEADLKQYNQGVEAWLNRLYND